MTCSLSASPAPTPSQVRPVYIDSRVAAACATTAGWKRKLGQVTPGPRSPRVRSPTAASTDQTKLASPCAGTQVWKWSAAMQPEKPCSSARAVYRTASAGANCSRAAAYPIVRSATRATLAPGPAVAHAAARLVRPQVAQQADLGAVVDRLPGDVQHEPPAWSAPPGDRCHRGRRLTAVGPSLARMSEQSSHEQATVPGVQVVMDAADPHALAEFWAAALGYEVEDVGGFAQEMLDEGRATEADVLQRNGVLVWRDASAARDPGGVRPRLYVQRVPEPKTVKNRVHLDLHVGPERVEAEVERLVALGATRVEERSQGPQRWVVMTDPEGGELCVS